MIVLYSNHCPCCEVLRARLDEDRQREEEKRHYNHVQEGSECP